MRRILFVLSLICIVQSLAQHNSEIFVLKNKYTNGSVELKKSDLGLINKFIFVDIESKSPISGIVVIYGKKDVSYHISENGVSRQSIGNIKSKKLISYELTIDTAYYSETFDKGNLKSVYTIVKSENGFTFYHYEIRENYILLKHSFSQNGKLQTDKSKIVEIPSCHRLPMEQFKLMEYL